MRNHVLLCLFLWRFGFGSIFTVEIATNRRQWHMTREDTHFQNFITKALSQFTQEKPKQSILSEDGDTKTWTSKNSVRATRYKMLFRCFPRQCMKCNHDHNSVGHSPGWSVSSHERTPCVFPEQESQSHLSLLVNGPTQAALSARPVATQSRVCAQLNQQVHHAGLTVLGSQFQRIHLLMRQAVQGKNPSRCVQVNRKALAECFHNWQFTLTYRPFQLRPHNVWHFCSVIQEERHKMWSVRDTRSQ